MKFQALRDLISAAGGRRFVLTVGAGVIHGFLLWFGKLTESGYVTLTVATVGAYIAGNTIQKIKKTDAGTNN
jgi:hypothetical protein